MKILIIDDEKDLVTGISFQFKAAGYEVDSANDGVTGLQKAGKFDPDLIVLDIMMPEMDGYEVAKQLKADDETANIPILFLTAAVTPTLADRIKEVGAVDYVTKPFDPNELVRKVKDVIGD